MASAIGFRVYRITVNEKHRRGFVDLDDPRLDQPVPAFFWEFIKKHELSHSDPEMERSYFFDVKDFDKSFRSSGHVNYGTFGFESDLVDNNTKKKNYTRLTTDVEQIPLFYDIWFPEGRQFGLMGVQSFQARSCVQMVTGHLLAAFNQGNEEFTLRFSKLMPNDAHGSVFGSAPVKRLHLISKETASGLAARYAGDSRPSHIGVELTLSAGRKGSFGPFGSLSRRMRAQPKSLLAYEGVEFDEATAEIKLGKKLRTVGVLGGNNNAGVIDFTESVKRESSGHPKYGSIKAESKSVLKDFFETLDGPKS